MPKANVLPSFPTMSSRPDTTLRDGLSNSVNAALAETHAGLLRAESSQIQFNATRIHLTGRREVLEAVLAYLNDDPSKLVALAHP